MRKWRTETVDFLMYFDAFASLVQTCWSFSDEAKNEKSTRFARFIMGLH